MANFLTEQDTMFGTIAFRNKLITKVQLGEAVIRVQAEPDLRLGEVLLEMGYMTAEQVKAVLEMQQGQREKMLQQQAPPPPVPEPEPPEPAEPAEVPAVLEEAVVEKAPPVKKVQTDAHDIDFTMPGRHGSQAAPPPPPPPPGKPHQPMTPPPKPRVVPGPAAGAKSLYTFLAEVRQMDASDLHISAEVKPFVRKAGRLETLPEAALSAAQTDTMLFSVLSQEQKTHLLQHHSLEFCLDSTGEGRYRATIFKQRCGYDGIFRVIRSTVPSMEELGLPDCLRLLTEYNQGLVLVTGPGNSGKTTTLAALIDAINRERTDHIITVEKPVEYLHQPQQCQVTQRQVGIHTDSFSVALRAALREDPDVIMVGELHDLETLSMAITASETGHLVFGTLHTTSATSTVGRVVDAFPVGQQSQIRMMVSESLRGILSQQLVPRIAGGVALALEILFVTPAVSALIRDNQPHQISSVMQTSRKMGMCRMDDSLMELVNAGEIDGAEAYRRAENKTMFEHFKNVAE